MVLTQDFFLFYVRYISSLFFSNYSNELSFESFNSTLRIMQNPSGNVSFGHKITYTCNLISTADCEPVIFPKNLVFEWYLKFSDTKDFQLVKSQIDTGVGKLDIIFNTTKFEAIFCKAIDNTTELLIGEAKSPLYYEKLNFSYNSEQPTPVNFIAAYVESRSAVISWKNPHTLTDMSHLIQYRLEYKMTRVPWDLAKSVTISAADNSFYVQDLLPWTMYHFRVTAIYDTGKSTPSYPIVVLTKEEAPSSPPENVKVKIDGKNHQTLVISWKPAPRSTWGGALLGYNIGFRKETSPTEEPYTFHVLTAFELLGKPCLYELSVPDSTIIYKVVVQAFNNVGPGPLSTEASSG